MVVVVVLEKVADNFSSMTLVRQKMWLEFVIEASNEHRSLKQTTSKIYNTSFKMCTPILVTKLERVNGYAQFRTNQNFLGMILFIRGV